MSDTKDIKLNLGCGSRKLEGWTNVDAVSEFQPDLLHDISQPLPFADLSVDEILAEDVLEHFDKYMRFVVFGDWARVLKIGGTMTLQVPDFKKLLLRYFKFGFDKFVDMVFGENMFNSQKYIGHYGNHKWGYSQGTLKDFVKIFGLQTQHSETKGLNIRLVAQKTRHVAAQELDELKIYSHANSFGDQPVLPLKFVREKIKIFREK